MSLKTMKVDFKINLSVNDIKVNLMSETDCVHCALWFNKDKTDNYKVELDKQDLLKLSKLLSEFAKLDVL